LAAAALLLLIVQSQTAAAADVVRAFLASSFDLAPDELTRLDEGQVIARTLEAKDRREVATFGIVHIQMAPSVYVERLTDIVNFKRNENVLQIGTFSDPPQVSDVAALTVDDPEIRRLRECRVDDCGVRLSAEAIERFRKQIDWRAGDAAARATTLFRQVLVDYVARYRVGGPAAAMEYADTPKHMNTAAEFASLLLAESATWRHVPALRRHLAEFPATDKARSTDFIYWSKERVNGRPVISITHVAIVRVDDAGPVRYAIASRQLYAMHYYDASLGVTLLIADANTSSPDSFVVYLNRSRIDLFGRMFGGVARRLAAGKARGLVAEVLGRLKTSMDRQRP
jgi:hypothetical protein